MLVACDTETMIRQDSVVMKDPYKIAYVNKQLGDKNAFEILQWCYEEFPPEKIKLSTSFGAEGMVLLHMLASLGVRPRVFTIDTGRNFQEYYDVWEEAIARYGITIESFHPDPEDLTDLVNHQGPNLFYASSENRKKCCYYRKVKPLKRALADADVWITGLRKEQGPSRSDIDVFSYSKENRVYKVCPLANWLEINVWEYIRNNGVPYNKLYDEGYPTIGCAPCCRRVGRAQDIRTGRWWWEKDEQKECGIHIENGRTQPRKSPSNYSI
ncbi:MAG: phosphoadenylyl-sulfate reductase [Chitinivibrionales bacterium]|nr:phosphoadenylyl-sulfate reductase [Chitinivibrionales bacterium]